jgi:hypothetical protein
LIRALHFFNIRRARIRRLNCEEPCINRLLSGCDGALLYNTVCGLFGCSFSIIRLDFHARQHADIINIIISHTLNNNKITLVCVYPPNRRIKRKFRRMHNASKFSLMKINFFSRASAGPAAAIVLQRQPLSGMSLFVIMQH